MKISNGLLAAFIAPAVSSMLMALVSPITGEATLVSVLGFFLFFYPFSLLAEVFLGGPMFILLFYLGIVRWWSAAICGTFVGVIVAYLLQIKPGASISSLLFYGGVGAISAFSFWIIWRKKQSRLIERAKLCFR